MFAGGWFMVQDTRFPTFRSGLQEQRYYNFAVSPVRDADGVVLAAACFTTDRTPKLAVQQEIAIVEAHGGRIWAENNDGGGLPFT